MFAKDKQRHLHLSRSEVKFIHGVGPPCMNDNASTTLNAKYLFSLQQFIEIISFNPDVYYH